MKLKDIQVGQEYALKKSTYSPHSTRVVVLAKGVKASSTGGWNDSPSERMALEVKTLPGPDDFDRSDATRHLWDPKRKAHNGRIGSTDYERRTAYPQAFVKPWAEYLQDCEDTKQRFDQIAEEDQQASIVREQNIKDLIERIALHDAKHALRRVIGAISNRPKAEKMLTLIDADSPFPKYECHLS